MKSKPGMIFVFLIFVAVILPFVSAYSPTFSSDVPANESVLYTPLKIALVPEAKEGGYAFAQYSRDLELWLTFEDNSSSALDSSTYGRHGIYRSNATRSTTLAKTGAGSLYIPGSFSHLLIPSSVNAAFDPMKGYTVSFWFYPVASNSGGTFLGSVGGSSYQGTYFKIDNSTTGSGNRLYQSYGAYNTIRNVGLNYRINDSLTGGSWHQLTFVNFKDYTLLYIDGRLNGGSVFPKGESCNALACTNHSTASFYIGSVQSFGMPSATQGYFDDILIFSRPLKENEVKNLYDYNGNFTSDVFFKLHSQISTQAILTNSSGYINSSELRSFFPATTEAYFYQTHQRFEAHNGLSSSGVFTTPSFYYSNSSSLNSNALWQARLSHRVNNGSWIQQGPQMYKTFNPEEWSGVFGDSIMGPGGTGTWPRYLDFHLHSYFYPNESLMNGVGGHRCFQVFEQFRIYSINNTKAIINCGANDANDPAVTTAMSVAAIDSILSLANQRNISVYLVGVTPHGNPAICTKIQSINNRFLWWYTQNNTNNFIKGYADVYNTPLKSTTDCTFNQTYFVDFVHPNDLGNIIIARTVWQQAFRGMTYDGWYNEFTPVARGVYDLNWTITSPEGDNGSYVFKNAFYLPPIAKVSNFSRYHANLNVS